MHYTGQPVKRFEDPHLVTGKGSFVDDVQLPDMLHAAVLRSPHAHARIRAIDVTAARSMPGVAAVLTGTDIAGVLGDVPTRAMVGGWDVDEMHAVEQPVLARGKVCYVGQPVAIVVAQDRYLAGDAVARIQVDYETLPPVLDPLAAQQAEAIPIPRAGTLPQVSLETMETPSPTNPLGVKGIGELPTVATPVAVANAIMDALASVGVRHIDTPLARLCRRRASSPFTPEKIWRALHGTGGD